MATCGSLRQIFEGQNPGIMDPLSSWGQIKALKPVEAASFTEIFGELHFQDKSAPLPPPSSLPSPPPPPPQIAQPTKQNPLQRSISLDPPPGGKHGGGFSAKNSESLQLCTEGLGYESSVDNIDDLVNDDPGGERSEEDKAKKSFSLMRSYSAPKNFRRKPCWEPAKKTRRQFPPPITSIRRSGKPGPCFRSYKEDGRFVLREVRVHNQEFLHARREDGRLKLHLINPHENPLEEEQEQELEKEGINSNGEEEHEKL